MVTAISFDEKKTELSEKTSFFSPNDAHQFLSSDLRGLPRFLAGSEIVSVAFVAVAQGFSQMRMARDFLVLFFELFRAGRFFGDVILTQSSARIIWTALSNSFAMHVWIALATLLRSSFSSGSGRTGQNFRQFSSILAGSNGHSPTSRNDWIRIFCQKQPFQLRNRMP